MTCVALLGGTGRLGRHVLAALLQRGLSVRMLVHRTQPEDHKAGIDVIHGDVHAPAAIQALLQGTDCVVATLGSARAAVPDVSATAVGNLLPTMRALGINRIVSTTGSAAREDREIGIEHPWLTARRTMLMHHMPKLILDGEKHLRMLRGSEMDWTVVRAPLMTFGHGEPATLAASPPSPDTMLTYEAVALALVEELHARGWLRAAPFAKPV